MAQTSVPGPALAWALHAACPAACVLFSAIRELGGEVRDFEWAALNPAAEALVRQCGLEGSASRWREAMEGMPDKDVLARVVETGEPHSAQVCCRPEGVERWFQLQALRHGDGVALWLFETTGASQELRQLRETLERERAEREEEARFRERFIGVLGHDLRNPLNAILLSTKALRRRGPLPPALQQMAQRIEASASRMWNMISDILDLTRARLSGGIPLRLGPVRLADVCRQVVEELSVVHPGRRIVLEEEGDCEGVWDPERLAQMFSNLVGNALEHGQPEGTIHVRSRGEGDRLVVEVSNPGAPIPEERLETMFNPFHPQGTERLGRRGGLGLGLFIVREIAEAHGGQVRVRSSAQEGTTFTIELPREVRRGRPLPPGEPSPR